MQPIPTHQEALQLSNRKQANPVLAYLPSVVGVLASAFFFGKAVIDFGGEKSTGIVVGVAWGVTFSVILAVVYTIKARRERAAAEVQAARQAQAGPLQQGPPTGAPQTPPAGPVDVVSTPVRTRRCRSSRGRGSARGYRACLRRC